MNLKNLLKPKGLVLVTGGAGYVGSIVVRRLLQAGHRVRVLDSLRFGDGSIRELHGNRDFEFHRGDIRAAAAVTKALKHVDSVVHLAAIVGDGACAKDPALTLETNYEATVRLTKLSQAGGVSRFVFSSTCSVYGQAEIADELTPPRPLSLYATTKLDAEKQVLAATAKGFHPTALRLGTLFGLSPRPRFDLIANLLAAQAATEGRIRIDGRSRMRPFVHVDDAARAFVTVLEAPLSTVSGELFCVGGSELNCQLGELADRIREFLPDVKVDHHVVEDRRSYDINFAKISHVLGYTPSRSLRSGIAEIIAAISDGQVRDYRDPEYHNNAPTISGATSSVVAARQSVAEAATAE